jgi:hypothetical protein
MAAPVVGTWLIVCSFILANAAASFAGERVLVAAADNISSSQHVSGGRSGTSDRHQAASGDTHHSASDNPRFVAAKAVACQYRYTTLLASLAGMVQDKKPITANLESPPPPIDLGSAGPPEAEPAPPSQVSVQCDDIVVGPKDGAVCRLIESPDQCISRDHKLILVLHADVDSE